MEAEEEQSFEEIEENFSTEEKDEPLEDEAIEESLVLDEATEESLVSEESNFITRSMDPGSSTTLKQTCQVPRFCCGTHGFKESPRSHGWSGNSHGKVMNQKN